MGANKVLEGVMVVLDVYELSVDCFACVASSGLTPH
jgi:hypothetical protein